MSTAVPAISIDENRMNAFLGKVVGDFGAALFAVAGLHSFADRRVGRVAAGGGMGCFDVGPAEIVGPVFA